MPRIVLGFAALAVLAVPCRGDQTGDTGETPIRLTVSPAPAPKPALRYTLLPELKEINPGNPIQNYYQFFMEQKKFFFDKEAFRRREELLAMPINELPARVPQDYGRIALSQADWAARLDNPDWQILPKLKTDGVSLRLPDVQELRGLARALQVRFRAEVALSRVDDALGSAKTMFAMSRHLGEHPTLIANLVGFDIANMAIDPLEEMLEQPGRPNLYWALTNLPTPLVPVDKGMEGERVVWMSEFRDLDDTVPMSTERLKKFIKYIDKLIAEPGKPNVQAWLDARTKDEGTVSAARHRLVENGLPQERLLRFSAEQVILLDERREYHIRLDDLMKTVNLPAWQAEAMMGQTKPGREWLFADAIVGWSVYRVHRKRWRLDQRIALLRHVEALRLYAAEHDGRLPAKLSEISVPLPDDPFTGKPFRYEVTGRTAHLRGTPRLSMERDPPYHIHYEVTVQK